MLILQFSYLALGRHQTSVLLFIFGRNCGKLGSQLCAFSFESVKLSFKRLNLDSELILSVSTFGEFSLNLLKVLLELFSLILGFLYLDRLPFSIVGFLLLSAKVQEGNFEEHRFGGLIFFSEFFSLLDLFLSLNFGQLN